jgi:hypothetical protein
MIAVAVNSSAISTRDLFEFISFRVRLQSEPGLDDENTATFQFSKERLLARIDALRQLNM